MSNSNYFNITRVKELHALNVGQASNSTRPVRFIHLMNPVLKEPDHELMRAQNITLASMRLAAKIAEISDPEIAVEMVATALPEDVDAIPDDFTRLDDLTQTSEDIEGFNIKRRLPLLYEILSRGRDAALASKDIENTYMIFTNVDIGVTNHFYSYCAWLVRHDYDFAVINRRSIEDHYKSVEDLPAMMSDFGTIHPGKDCFIIKADLLNYLIPTKSIVGMSAVMRSLYYNMMAYAKKAVLIRDAHATFHVGIDSDWMGKKYKDYTTFNKKECVEMVSRLEQSDPKTKERLEHFVRAAGVVGHFPPGMLGITAEEKIAIKEAIRAKKQARRKK
jgi:hypothetical protein